MGTVGALLPIGRNAVAYENLKTSFGDTCTGPEIRRVYRKVFMHFGQMVFEVPHILNLNPENLERYVVFHHEQRMREAFKRGKGVLVLTGHFGNWELMSAALALLFGKHAIVVRPVDFEPMDRFLNELRSRFGTEIIAKQRGMRRTMNVLRRNGAIGILLDQNVDWYEGVFVKFMKRWACTNKGLALLALKTGAPVIPIFNVRQRDGRIRIVFEKELQLIRTGDRIRDMEDNTALFTGMIETYIRRYPDHWFWFHRRWKTRHYCALKIEN